MQHAIMQYLKAVDIKNDRSRQQDSLLVAACQVIAANASQEALADDRVTSLKIIEAALYRQRSAPHESAINALKAVARLADGSNFLKR
jgi:hypothetical protein